MVGFIDRDELQRLVDEQDASAFGMLVALNADGIVVGRLDRDATADDAQTVDRLMREGPTTMRPSPALQEADHADR